MTTRFLKYPWRRGSKCLTGLLVLLFLRLPVGCYIRILKIPAGENVLLVQVTAAVAAAGKIVIAIDNDKYLLLAKGTGWPVRATRFFHIGRICE